MSYYLRHHQHSYPFPVLLRRLGLNLTPPPPHNKPPQCPIPFKLPLSISQWLWFQPKYSACKSQVQVLRYLGSSAHST